MADKNSGLGDDQGTRVGSPSTHNDGPSGRPERATGSGTEATQATDGSAEGHETEHRSGYGGSKGKPVESSDKG